MLGWRTSSRIIGPGLAHWTIGPEIRPGTPHGLKIKPKSSSIQVGFGLTLLKDEAMGAGYFLPWVQFGVGIWSELDPCGLGRDP